MALHAYDDRVIAVVELVVLLTAAAARMRTKLGTDKLEISVFFLDNASSFSYVMCGIAVVRSR